MKRNTRAVAERESPPHKKRPRKKLFAIEERYVGKQMPAWLEQIFGRGWTVARRYETERDRDKALQAMNAKVGTCWEYRAASPAPAEGES